MSTCKMHLICIIHVYVNEIVDNNNLIKYVIITENGQHSSYT